MPCLKLQDFSNEIGMGNRGGSHHATYNVRSIDDVTAAVTSQEYGARIAAL